MDPENDRKKREGREGGKLELTSIWLQEVVPEAGGERRSSSPGVLFIPDPTMEKKNPTRCIFGAFGMKEKKSVELPSDSAS